MHDIHVCGIMYRVTGDRTELDGPSNLPVYSNKFPARVSVLLQDARTGNPVHEYLDKAEITMKLHMRRNGEEESRHIKTGIPYTFCQEAWKTSKSSSIQPDKQIQTMQ